jgi:hypothetical protein
MTYFDTGLIKIGNTTVKVQEITVNVTREVNEVYTSEKLETDELRHGRKKIDFTIKRALDNGRLSQIFETGCVFPILLYNNDTTPPTPLMVLEGCRLSKDSIGNFDGSKPVTQDIDGKAIRRRLLLSSSQNQSTDDNCKI